MPSLRLNFACDTLSEYSVGRLFRPLCYSVLSTLYARFQSSVNAPDVTRPLSSALFRSAGKRRERILVMKPTQHLPDEYSNVLAKTMPRLQGVRVSCPLIG